MENVKDETPKYKSLAAALVGVLAVDAPLSQGARLVLMAMAVVSDYHTGLTRPGNERLRVAAGLKGHRGVRFIISQLIGQRLVERRNNGDGRMGTATTFRIKFEDPRFPNPKKPGSSNCRVLGSDGKGTPAVGYRGSQPGPRQFEAVTPEVINPNPGSNKSEPRKSELPHSLTSSLTSSPTPSPNPAPEKSPALVENGGWGEFRSLQPKEMTGTTITNQDRQQLEALIEKHGAEPMAAAIYHWSKKRELPVDGLGIKYSFFLNEWIEKKDIARAQEFVRTPAWEEVKFEMLNPVGHKAAKKAKEKAEQEAAEQHARYMAAQMCGGIGDMTFEEFCKRDAVELEMHGVFAWWKREPMPEIDAPTNDL